MKKINWAEKILELVVVVVGILIAFALNNFAQNRKDARQERQHLAGIRADLVQDSLDLSAATQHLRERIKIGERVIPMMYNEEIPERDSAFAYIFRDMTSYEPFVPNSSTFDALRYSGSLNGISDFDLRGKLVSHYDRYKILDFENTRSYIFTTEVVNPYMMNEIPFEKLRFGYDDYLEDYRLRNIVFAWTGIYQLQIKAHEEALQRCRMMIEATERAPE